MNISLHIERLVLEGVPLGEGDARRVQAAVTAELARLIAGGGVGGEWPSRGALEYARGSDIRLAAGEGPDVVGRRIAGALYGGIAR